jgi:hypothetical protein
MAVGSARVQYGIRTRPISSLDWCVFHDRDPLERCIRFRAIKGIG